MGQTRTPQGIPFILPLQHSIPLLYSDFPSFSTSVHMVQGELLQPGSSRSLWLRPNPTCSLARETSFLLGRRTRPNLGQRELYWVLCKCRRENSAYLELLTAILPPRQENLPKTGAARMNSQEERRGEGTWAPMSVAEPQVPGGLKFVYPCRFH